MPPAAAAAAPSALGWAGIGLGGASLLDNIFGSGADARNQQRRANDQMYGLAREEQDFSNFIRQLLQEKMENPPLPKQYVDLDPFVQQFLPGVNLLPQSLYRKLGPDIISKGYLDQLAGTMRNPLPAASGAASIANMLGESRRDEFSENIQNIMWALGQQAKSPYSPPTSQINPGGLSDPFGSFFGFRG